SRDGQRDGDVPVAVRPLADRPVGGLGLPLLLLLPGRRRGLRDLPGRQRDKILAGHQWLPFSDSSPWWGACREEVASSPTLMFIKVASAVSDSPNAIAAACRCWDALDSG